MKPQTARMPEVGRRTRPILFAAMICLALTVSLTSFVAPAAAEDYPEMDVASSLPTKVGWANIQMQYTGADRYQRDVERRILLELYTKNPGYPAAQAAQEIAKLRVQAADRRRSPDGKRLDAINAYLDVAKSISEVLPPQAAPATAFVGAVRTAVGVYTRYKAEDMAVADTVQSMIVDYRATAEIADTARENYQRLREKARGFDRDHPDHEPAPNAELEKAYNYVFQPTEHAPLLADTVQTMNGNPVLKQFFETQQLIDVRTGELKTEIRDGVRVVRFDIDKLRAEFSSRMDATDQQLDAIQDTLQSVQQQQTELNNSFTAYVADQEAKERAQALAAAAAAEHEQVLAGLNASVQLIASIVGGDEGRYISTLGHAAIQIGETISQWTTAVSKLADLANPVNFLNTVSMVMSVVSVVSEVVAMLGPPPPPTIEEQTFAAVQQLQQQVAQLGQHIDSRFDRLDAALNTVYTTMSTGFSTLHRDLLDIRRVVGDLLDKMNRMYAQLQHLSDALRQYSEAAAVQDVQNVIDHSLNFTGKHPNAGDLPYDQFLTAQDRFWGFATRQAGRDPRLIGAEGRPVTWDTAAAELARPVEANLRYLDDWSKTLLGKPAATAGSLGGVVTNPRAWAWGSSAYVALALEWPDYARRDADPRTGRISQLDELVRTGRGIQAAFDRLARDDDLWTAVQDGYRDASSRLNTAIVDDQRRILDELARPRAGGVSSAALLWNDYVDGRLRLQSPDLPTVTELPSCDGRSDAIAAPSNLATGIPDPQPAPGVVAEPQPPRLDYIATTAARYGIRDTRVCYQAAWTDKRTDGLHQPTRGHLTVSVRAEVRSPDPAAAGGASWQPVAHLDYTVPDEYVICTWEVFEGVNGKPRLHSSCEEPGRTAASVWPSGLRTGFEQSAKATADPPQAELVSAIEHERERLIETYTSRLLNDLAGDKSERPEIRDLAIRADAYKNLLSQYVQLALPRAYAADDYLQMLLQGPSLVVDGTGFSPDGSIVGGTPDLAPWLLRPRPDQVLPVLVQTSGDRAKELDRVIDQYRDQVKSGAYVETYPVVRDTLDELEILAQVLGAPAG